MSTFTFGRDDERAFPELREIRQLKATLTDPAYHLGELEQWALAYVLSTAVEDYEGPREPPPEIARVHELRNHLRFDPDQGLLDPAEYLLRYWRGHWFHLECMWGFNFEPNHVRCTTAPPEDLQELVKTRIVMYLVEARKQGSRKGDRDLRCQVREGDGINGFQCCLPVGHDGGHRIAGIKYPEDTEET